MPAWRQLAPHVRHRQHIGAPTEAAFPSKRQQFFQSSVVGLEIGATNVLHELRLIPGTSPHRSGSLSLRSERCAGGGSSATALLPNHPEPRQSIPTSISPKCRDLRDRKSTRLNSSHLVISYAVFCLK